LAGPADGAGAHHGDVVRLFGSQRRPEPERLFWSRDARFADRVATAVPSARRLELDSGYCLIGPADELTDGLVAQLAGRRPDSPQYGVASIDVSLPEADRYIRALSEAIRLSGIADRVAMGPSMQVVQTKTLDLFFATRHSHHVVFQPIVELATGELHEYEALFRPVMPSLPHSITAIVQAAIDTVRSIELDQFIVRLILERAGEINQERTASGGPPLRIAINVTPASLLAEPFAAPALAELVRSVGLSPRQITMECTEQQAVSEIEPLKRQVKALRKLGFGFAVDDAGAGYASFALIAALRPSIIKIDREIVHGIKSDDAKQALVEAFVSFGRRIGARLVAEGIETRRDRDTLRELGVQFGQGYLLGKPDAEPREPRAVDRPIGGRRKAPAAARARGAGARLRAVIAD
jgi:EAL domain-containing protein (putative c-di-GMP-specific phosphodiesterase class I)